MFSKFTVKELVLIALIVVTIFLLGYILIPLMSMVPLPAYKALIVGPIYGIGITVLINKVNRFGVITLTGALLGLILSVFTPLMLMIPVISGLFTELICYLIFRNYKTIMSQAVAGGLFPALHVPVTMILMGFIIGGAYLEAIKNPLFIIIPTVLTYGIAFFVSYYGCKILINRKL